LHLCTLKNLSTKTGTKRVSASNYEAVIGLEIHCQLNTLSKAYSSDATLYGAAPNTQVSPVSLGHPGTLPVLNEAVVRSAVLLGLAVDAQIRPYNVFARKNYFYADLPKGYQITQHHTPICNGGQVRIVDKAGNEKFIGITRIHMEEDSGKSMHDVDPFNTLIDLNRAGVPLLEIVSEPDFRSGEEAYNYLAEMRKLVRYLGISDGNMEEGSLRCDVNVSVRPVGREAFGTKVEIKNMNSFRNVQKAIDFEIDRQINLIESGGSVSQETRTFDAAKGVTTVMRTKEDAHDYRYFTEPDLPPLVIENSYVEAVKATMPPLPQQLFNKYTELLGLSEYDAGVLTEQKAIALYFEELLAFVGQAKIAANWMMGPVKSYLNEKAIEINDFPLNPKQLASLIDLVLQDLVSNSAASQTLLPAFIESPDSTPKQLAENLNLLQESDDQALAHWVNTALDAYPDKVIAYREGKKGLLGLFMGEVMKQSGGKADPKKTSQMLKEILDN
jgi:aspartyl-tRNA(Asn)/glutamyl-tRNA(Gln) amidotransferase subunit B